MRKIIFLMCATFSVLFACEGDCFKCHTLLKTDTSSKHAVIKECVSCHAKNIGKQANNSMCGADCFSCHTVEHISQNISAHKAINGCMSCHALNGSSALLIKPKTTLQTLLGK